MVSQNVLQCSLVPQPGRDLMGPINVGPQGSQEVHGCVCNESKVVAFLANKYMKHTQIRLSAHEQIA